MDFFIGSWRTTVAGLLMAAGTGLQYAGQPEIGAALLAVGSLLLGAAATDKTEVKEVKAQVQVVKTQVQDMKHVQTERAFLSHPQRVEQPLMPKPPHGGRK